MMDPSATSEVRKQLLEKLRRGEPQSAVSSLEPLRPRPLGMPSEISPDLEQLWIHDRRCGGVPSNNESFTIHRRGLLDRVILERCFNEIARRHEIWRSAFPMADGRVMQRVDSNVVVSLPLTDLSSLPAGERDTECFRIATEDASRPFDLDLAPLFRVHLIRWDENYHRVYLTAHRLIFDCASIERVLLPELGSLYDAFSAGREPELPEPTFQYGDYVAWKRRHMVGGSRAVQIEYWRQGLSGDLPVLELPTDRPRPARPTWRSEMETCAITPQTGEEIQRLGTSERVTPYMVILAAFEALLHRYSGQREIVLGGKTSTRTRPEFESLLGSFVNTIVFRSRIEPDLSFRQWLHRIKDTVLDALAHSDLPFDEMVRELKPHCDPRRHPLFQVLFSIRAPFVGLAAGWSLTDMEVHSGASGFDLFVEFAEGGQGWMGRFVYSTDLFERTSILRLIGEFQMLLKAFLTNPDRLLSEIPLVVPKRPGAAPTGGNASPTILESLPKKAAGALDPTTLPAPELPTQAQHEFVPPEDDVEERLVGIWEEVMGIHPIGVSDNYFDLGGHSLMAIRLFSEIKFCFNVDLPLGTLFTAPTPRTMAAFLRNSGVQTGAPVIPIQPKGTKPEIFCIGALNGEVILFRRLSLELGEDQPMYGLQPFSLVNYLGSVEQLAAAYLEQLRKCGERRPFCLLGYSFGGLVAVEMARQLRRSGIEPPIVVLLDTSYLVGCKASEPWNDRMRRYRYHLNQIVHGDCGLHHLTDRLRSVTLRAMHKASTNLGLAMPRIASDVANRQLLAAENYRPKRYTGRVYLLKAESRPQFFDKPDLGWGKILSDLRIEDVPGDHGTINTGVNLKILARKLKRFLADGTALPDHIETRHAC